MRNIWLIAKREYLEQIRGKSFKVTTILIPVVFLGVFGVIVFAGKNAGSGKHIAIASNDAALANRVRDALVSDKDAHMAVEVVAPATMTDRQRLLTQVDQKHLDGFLWLTPDAGGAQPQATFVSRSSGDFATQGRLADAVSHSVVAERLASRGIAPGEVAALTKDVSIKTVQVKNGRETGSNAVSTFIAAYIMAFLLTFTLMMYGMNVGRSVIQEKTSRIFEVMLSKVTAGEMLGGKLVGIGAVGLTQLGIWVGAAAVFSGSTMAANMMFGGMKFQISPVTIVLFALYFVLGYALYSALFAGLAATCDTEQELQQYTPLAAVPIWLSFGMLSYIISNPNAPLSVAISLFPPCAPITMFLRMASQYPPAWQIGLSLLLLAIAVLIVLWLSSRIYRVGILMYGKRATLPEMLRWLRYS